MERTFLLLVAFIFSSGQCLDIGPFHRGARVGASQPGSDVQILDPGSDALQESTLAVMPRVAFTVALGHNLGPLPIDTAVKYPVIISNMDNGYNPATGSFTARLPGVYYFSYTMYNDGDQNTVVALMKNGQRMVSTWNTRGGNTQDSSTNAAVLQLEAGDSVHTQLYASRKLFDDAGNYNTFSGFLLFPL